MGLKINTMIDKVGDLPISRGQVLAMVGLLGLVMDSVEWLS